MNNTHQAELVASVERIAADLHQANQDVARLRRLKAAEADAKRLTNELQAAQDALSEANASWVLARREAAIAHFRDITVTRTGDEAGVLHGKYLITVTQVQWDGHEQIVTRTYTGFDSLPSDALSYLLNRHPDRVPAAIMALAPGEPWRAVEAYSVALRRGYLTGNI